MKMIFLAGPIDSGKTELLKYLISRLESISATNIIGLKTTGTEFVYSFEIFSKKCIIFTHGDNSKYVFSDFDKYEALVGNRTGRGKYTWANGDVYEGDFINGFHTGKGKYTWANGDVYEGDFSNNFRTGKGKYTWADGKIYEGYFIGNMMVDTSTTLTEIKQ